LSSARGKKQAAVGGVVVVGGLSLAAVCEVVVGIVGGESKVGRGTGSLKISKTSPSLQVMVVAKGGGGSGRL